MPAEVHADRAPWAYLQNYAEKHSERATASASVSVGPDDVARTLSARYYKDGSEILVRQGRENRAV